MIRKITMIALGSLLAVGATAAPLTPEQAISRLKSSSQARLATKGVKASKLVYTLKTAIDTPAIYVFDTNNSYMLVSADDIAYPVLGYADGEFDANNIPPQMQWWLDQYAQQIYYAQANGVFTSSAAPRTAAEEGREVIAPMIKTKWDQGNPYYNSCPTSNSTKTYTGCVATAMAQAMNYWKYPEIGEGKITYKTATLNKTLMLDLSKTAFDWDNMLDEYVKGSYTDEQAEAVAYLMKACGYSVQMDYNTDASGASSLDIAPALKNYFKYDSNVRLEKRDYYSATEWEQMIYDNLKNVGPLIYDGQSSVDGGHSFICDGYDANGYFHFNWGWSGASDGYFVLNALNPDALGVGGGSGGFNFTQDAILGIQPPTGEAEEERVSQITMNGSLTATRSGVNLVFDLIGQDYPTFVNNTGAEMVVKFGAIFEPVDGTEGETIYKEVTNLNALTFPSGSGFYQTTTSGNKMTPQVRITGISEGRYKVTLATIDQNVENAPYVPVITPYQYVNYIYFTRSGSTYTIETIAPRQMSIDSATLDTDLYYNCMAKMTLTLSNPSDVEITQGFAPALFIGNTEAFIGDSMLVTIPAGETVTKELVSQFYLLSGSSAVTSDTDMTLVFYDPATYSLYEGGQMDVTMKANPGSPTIQMMSVSLSGTNNSGVYTITDKENIKLDTKLKVSKGYFAYPLYVMVVDSSGNILLTQSLGAGTTFMSAGETKEFSAEIDFSQGAPDETYRVLVAYVRNNSYVTVGAQIRFIIDESESGVSEISTSEEALSLLFNKGEKKVYATSSSSIKEMKVYDMSGSAQGVETTISGETAVSDLSELGRGVYVVSVKAANGEVKTRKIVL